MTQPQILAVFADAAADPRFPIALGIAALAGLVRGFSGFGSALVYMPLVSAVYSPQIAVATLLLIDSISSHSGNDPRHSAVQLARSRSCHNCRLARPAARRRDAGSSRSAAAALVHLRVGAGRVGHARRRLALSRQADDCRFGRRRRCLPVLARGAVQIGAPPLLVYWLGGQNSAITVRANIMVYFIMQGVMSMVVYYLQRAVHRAGDRAVGAARRAVRDFADRRRALVSRHQRRALSPRRLYHYRDGRIDQPAAVRRATLTSSASARPTPRNWRRRSARRRCRPAFRSA